MSFFLDDVLDDDISDLAYKNIRDLDGYFLSARRFIEWLWIKCNKHKLVDSDHQIQAKTDLHSRFWEKYLAITLLNRKLNPIKQGEGYPDFTISKMNFIAHIEAIAPNRGNGPDSVQINATDGTYDLPKNQIHLRLTHAIEQKYKKWQKTYSTKNNILEEHPFIIAINGKGIHHTIKLLDPPAILEVLFAIGNLTINIDDNDSNAFYESKSQIKKSNDSSVRLGYFHDDNYSEISGILYSNVDCINKRPKRMGGDFIYIPNPYAKNKLPSELFSFCTQYCFKRIDEHNYWFDIIKPS